MTAGQRMRSTQPSLVDRRRRVGDSHAHARVVHGEHGAARERRACAVAAQQREAALARAQEVVANEWGDGLIRSWNQAGWFKLPRRLGNKIAPLIGAREDEVVVTDTTSINLFKVLAAAIRVQLEDAPARKIIVSETHNFPTDLYIAEGLADLLRDGYKLRLIDSPEELEGALGDDVAQMGEHVGGMPGRGGRRRDCWRGTVGGHRRGRDVRRVRGVLKVHGAQAL